MKLNKNYYDHMTVCYNKFAKTLEESVTMHSALEERTASASIAALNVVFDLIESHTTPEAIYDTVIAEVADAKSRTRGCTSIAWYDIYATALLGILDHILTV